MTQHPWPLRWFIGGTYLCIMIAVLGVMAMFFAHQYTRSTREIARGAVRWQTLMCAQLLSTVDNPGDAQSVLSSALQQPQSARPELARPRQVLLLAPDGTVLASMPPVDVTTRPLAAEGQRALREAYVDVEHYDAQSTTALLTASARVRFDHGLRETPDTTPFYDAVLIVETSLDTPQWWTAPPFTRGAIFAFIAIILTFLVLNFFISQTIARPIVSLSAVARRLARGDLYERVVPAGAAEIASLGRSFNGMATQLRQTISRLEAERAQARAMLSSMTNGIIVIDRQGRLLLVNHSAEQLFGILASQVVGRTLTDATLHYELQDLLAKTQEQGTPQKQDIVLTHPQSRTVEVHLAPVMVDERLDGVVIALYDVTQQRQMHEIHRDFVANVSHELRTPVASIRAMSETLLDAGNECPEMTTDFLQTIISESERLTALLDDLLHLSRMDAGRQLITPELLDAGMVIRDVATRLATPIAHRHQELLLDIPAELPAFVDHDALVQILVNLIDNARKYSPEYATITVRGRTQDDGATIITVSDTGYGIPRHALGRVFERFYRVDKGRSRMEGGTGLGLSIVKQLVELHGGSITVESQLGEGTSFIVIIPPQQLDVDAPTDTLAAHLPSTAA